MRRRCIRMKTMEINEMTQTLIAHILQRRHHRRGSAQWNSGNAPSAPFFFFLRLIEELYTTHCSRVAKPVACCSVQHHQVSVTTVQRTFAGDVMWVWSVAPHSHDADGDISTRFIMLDLNQS